MGKNREDCENCRGKSLFEGRNFITVDDYLRFTGWAGRRRNKRKRNPECECSGNDSRRAQKHILTQRFVFFSSSAFCHLPSLCSLLKCPSRQFALCFGLQESTLQSCVDPICDMAFDFALHLCTSWVIKRQERGQRNVRCCSQPQTHIVQLGCCQSPMCHLHF